MRSRITALAALVSTFALTGCYAAYGNNALNTGNLQGVDFSKQLKTGQSCAITILGIVTDGSALISDAAKVGGIKKIHLVENKATSNPLFSKSCVIVTGE